MVAAIGIDKSWLNIRNRVDKRYRAGVDDFLNWAFSQPRVWDLHEEVLVRDEEIEHPMTRDEILSSVLGERSGYVSEKGYEKKPPRKTQTQQANIEANMSSVMKIMHQEMQADMDRKLQEERVLI
ncbi:hypothetical protein RND71_003433 [Anisodus tanguticus]|uniref:Uncharacterized protein n=1 Tax=Anisodus tanguticus TaxID=243964 RepID=A0AAE1VPZ3_9SOLA|nr:hypothetical protein RND71_003433 [Anisodus tanguticus]